MKSKVHPTYKTKYRVSNWPAYNRAFVRRGDVTVWLSSEASAAWTPRRSGRRGGQRQYSDLAIETALTLRGIDAPICQDIPLGGTRDGLARAEVCHDTVVDLAGEEAFETPDDLASGPTVRGPSRDVVEGRLVVPHADDDGAREGRIGVSVPASIEAVPAGGDPRRSGDGTRATEFRKGGFRANPVGGIAEEDQHRRRGIGPHPEARSEGGRRRGGESREVLLVRRDFFGQGGPAAGERPEGVLGGCGRRVKGAWSESGAAGEEPVIGEGVEGFTPRGRRVHDDLLQGDHRRGARLHRGIPRDLELAHHLDGAIRGLRVAVDWPANTDRAATSASTVSDFPAARRVRRSPRLTSTTRCPAWRTVPARPAP